MTRVRFIRDLTLTAIFICFAYITSSGQIYYVTSFQHLLKVQLNEDICTCDVTTIGPHPNGFGGMTFSPEGELYYLQDSLIDAQTIQHVDTLTSYTINTLMSGPNYLRELGGIVGVGNGIFYSSPPVFTIGLPPQDTLYRWDTNDHTVAGLGATGWGDAIEMCISNGVIYYIAADLSNNLWHIIQVDTLIPSNSQIVASYNYSQYYVIQGLSASPYCNSLVGTFTQTGQLVLISLIDGAITVLCEIPETIGYGRVTSMQEFAPEPPCGSTLDLDCNNSSGATGANYNGPDFNCLSPGSGIADEDIKMLYDDVISQMTIEVTGSMPDAPYELVFMTGTVPGINVSGSGTTMITLSNGGGARSTDFKTALRLIVYRNTALNPTAGIRTIHVQFTTESGTMSNIAIAFIHVTELPQLVVDLGPDQERCDGETATFNAGNPGAIYHWNTGQTSQAITVGNSGEYIVHVANGILCPNNDTVVLDIIPVIHVSLIGDSAICDNQHANMTIITDTPFPLDVEITPNPGSPFTLTGVENNYTFFDLILGLTEYTITNVIPSQPACIELVDSTQLIDVFQTYTTSVDTSICSGDSIYLGYYWENQAGQYNILFYSAHGCDSTVNFTISVSPAINISVQSTTCDSAAAGVFITYLNNPNGCDTSVTTTVTFIAADTTIINLVSCNISNAGTTTQTFVNQTGCDSLVITDTNWIPPADTTHVYQTTCDSTLLGVFQQFLLAQDGCDSLIITSVTIAPGDTTYRSGISCDSASIGVFQTLLSNMTGCDSLVITTISAGVPDTTLLFSTSCDSSSLGVFETHFSTSNHCDSTVIQTITYSAQDSTFVAGSSCDPADAGVFVHAFINRFGCDSIVTQTIELVMSDFTAINSTTCDPAMAGVFVDSLINKNGCDSIVTSTIAYAMSDHLNIFSTTCHSSSTGVFVDSLTNQNGCDSIVTLIVSLVAADTTILSFKTCDPSQVGSIQNYYINQDGCDSLVIEQTSLYPLPLLNAEATSDFNGFDISCSGEADGSVTANVSGIPPFSYSWSTGDTNQSITNLIAGSYAVTITDANGCKTNSEVTLNEPGPFMVSFVVSQPGCFDQKNGNITVEQTGGVAPIRYSIDGINYQPSPSFTNLGGGTYQITALDANGCEQKEIIGINVPLQVNVELGDDQVIESGDTAIIHAIVNVPFDSLASIVWSGISNPNCPTCLTQTVVPINTSTYSVTVSTVDGCSDEDALTLFLEKHTEVFIPNIFSPNGDDINDRLIISAGSDVEEISSFVIFDRWGNNVFAAEHFQANDPNYGWDGTLKGSKLNSGVFAFKLVAVFKDGKEQIRVGDVTLVR